MGGLRDPSAGAQRRAGRTLRCAALLTAAALLASCTPGGPGEPPSPSAPSTPAAPPSSPAEPSASSHGDDATPGDGSSMIVGAAPAEDGLAPLAPGDGDHPELGRGTGAPLAEGTESSGLTWADGRPVRLDVVAVSQAKRVAAEELQPKLSQQWGTTIAGLPDGFSLVPASTAGADGALEKVLAVAISDAYFMGDDPEPALRPRAGYVDATGWHGGPRINANPFGYGTRLVWAAGGRLYWVDDGATPDPDGPSRDWSINSWAPGEKKTTVVADGADTSLDPPCPVWSWATPCTLPPPT